MNTKHADVVAEYLHEVDLRLSGLPVLQRRELLADLAAHIATERTERDIKTEGELIEVLERLGTPEIVAAAAYEEASAYPPVPTARRRRWIRPYWLPATIGGAVVLIILVLCGALAVSHKVGSVEQSPVPVGPVATATPGR